MGKNKRTRKRQSVYDRLRAKIKRLETENAALKAKLDNWGRPTKAEQAAKRTADDHLTLPLS